MNVFSLYMHLIVVHHQHLDLNFVILYRGGYALLFQINYSPVESPEMLAPELDPRLQKENQGNN